jgi:hypothetical protein
MIYALVALGYQIFYGDFGLAPSQVGITQTDIVAQAAVALALVGAVIGVIVLGFHLLFELIARRIGSRPVKITVEIFIVLVASALLAHSIPVLRSWFGLILTVVGVAYLSLVAGLVVRRRQVPLRTVLLLLTATIVVFLLAFIFVTARALALGKAVSEGYAIPSGDRLTVIFDVQVSPACASLSPRSPARLVYYLGQSNGYDFLFDPAAKKTIRRSEAESDIIFVPLIRWPYENGSIETLPFYKDLQGSCR